MDISYYYQILDIGILYEKGGKSGKRWKIGERKRLRSEIVFWQNLMDYISSEKKGIDCSEQLFANLEFLCQNYKLPNYERVLEKKQELLTDKCIFKIDEDEELKLHTFMNQLLFDMRKNLDEYKNKEIVYRILAIFHNLPKALHGNNILCNYCNIISYSDALLYAQGYMDEKLKKKYEKYLL